MQRRPADESGRGENMCAKRGKVRKHLPGSIFRSSCTWQGGRQLESSIYSIEQDPRSLFWPTRDLFLSLKRQTGEALVFAPVVA